MAWSAARPARRKAFVLGCDEGVGIVWDDKTLVEYLKDPKGRVPGTKMVYIGLKQEAQQADMIAFLKKATE